MAVDGDRILHRIKPDDRVRLAPKVPDYECFNLDAGFRPRGVRAACGCLVCSPIPSSTRWMKWPGSRLTSLGPVVTAKQVTPWKELRLLGYRPKYRELARSSPER